MVCTPLKSRSLQVMPTESSNGPLVAGLRAWAAEEFSVVVDKIQSSPSCFGSIMPLTCCAGDTIQRAFLLYPQCGIAVVWNESQAVSRISRDYFFQSCTTHFAPAVCCRPLLQLASSQNVMPVCSRCLLQYAACKSF